MVKGEMKILELNKTYNMDCVDSMKISVGGGLNVY